MKRTFELSSQNDFLRLPKLQVAKCIWPCKSSCSIEQFMVASSYLGSAEVLEAQSQATVFCCDVHPHGYVDDVDGVIRVWQALFMSGQLKQFTLHNHSLQWYPSKNIRLYQERTTEVIHTTQPLISMIILLTPDFLSWMAAEAIETIQPLITLIALNMQTSTDRQLYTDISEPLIAAAVPIFQTLKKLSLHNHSLLYCYKENTERNHSTIQPFIMVLFTAMLRQQDYKRSHQL